MFAGANQFQVQGAFFAGGIEVIVGSMFSGKTEELIRLLRRAQFAKQSIQLFKPKIDTRYSATHVASHNKSLLPSIVITHAAEIYTHLRADTQVVGVDEGQFFDKELVDVVNDLANRGIRVIIAGLDMNWKGEPFHPMPALMAVAESVRKLQAVCMVCGAPAARTQRLVKDPSNILVGDHTSYEARCRHCFDLSLSQSIDHDDDDEMDHAAGAHDHDDDHDEDIEVSVTVFDPELTIEPFETMSDLS